MFYLPLLALLNAYLNRRSSQWGFYLDGTRVMMEDASNSMAIIDNTTIVNTTTTSTSITSMILNVTNNNSRPRENYTPAELQNAKNTGLAVDSREIPIVKLF